MDSIVAEEVITEPTEATSSMPPPRGGGDSSNSIGGGSEISKEEGLRRLLPDNSCEFPTENLPYDHLCSGVLLDQKTKKYWIDPKTGYNYFMLFARDLSINCGDDQRHWEWAYFLEPSNVLVKIAELKKVCRLELRGKFETSNLSPGIMYEVAFVVMLKAHAHGWDVPVNLELILPDGKKHEHEESLLSNPNGQWVEILVGEFMTSQDMDGDLQFSLLEIKGGNCKSGLVIKGVIIRPKSCITKEQPLQNNQFSVIANDLSIEWGSDERYWRWSYSNNCNSFTNMAEAELIKVCWLEVKGKFNTSKLSSGIVYEVAFIVMLKDNAYGWEVPVTLQLALPNGKVQEHKECLLNKPIGQWIALYVGELEKRAEKAGEIEFSLFETEDLHWKKGLVIKNVVIHPKN
ncbi:F-box protein PP2-A15-like isoform X2 [Macadamia integrifolia]|uniref:F-box protein PP2-A15-like isoform X2 n=1 Tax=Macadamia integrifolia TaxID=60698 RepID=UPI001C4FF8AC|nr:F-box protein PP2-A15-like isoform X2 [Macadamia integrifolia]